jgi:WD40 repeat protein
MQLLDQWVVSASNDNTLKVWDIHTGAERQTLTGHDYWVLAMATTPDRRFVVSGSWDNTGKVWDLASGDTISTFDTEGEVNCCAVAPDGVTIVTGGRSDRVNFLRLEGMEALLAGEPIEA